MPDAKTRGEKINLFINNDSYVFEFKKNTYSDWDGRSLSELSVYCGDKRIFAVNVLDSYDDISDDDENKWMVSKDFSYYPEKITAFIKGEWVVQFNVLKKLIEVEKKKHDEVFKRDSLKRNAKVAKTNFGVK